jgi:hypothetical protein
MRLPFRRKHPVPWNRARVRDYERERAMQAFRGLVLFLFVAVCLGLVIAGSQRRLWFPESLWDFVTSWVDSQ